MRNDFIVFGQPIIEQPEIDEVVDSMNKAWLGTGPKVKQFEEMFRKYKGVNNAVALNSCTAALHLAMLALDIGPGDEVIVPTMTFAATANSVIHAGAKPVIVDCKKDTLNIDPEDIKRKITRKTKAIIVVHFAGRACEMNSIMKIARQNNLRVVEDCAHAIETKYHGQHAGTIGDIGCFSFYSTKNIVTGEGGMAITNNDTIAENIKIMGLHGMSQDAWKRFGDSGYKHYKIIKAGYKYNMMDIQAAIGIHQLPRVEKYWKRRKNIWDRYNDAFKNLEVYTPNVVEPDTINAFHLYPLLLNIEILKITRDEFMNEMYLRNIGVGVHYIALHLHPYYQEKYSYKKGDFPNAEWISERTVSIPLSAKLSKIDVEKVIESVIVIIKKWRN